RQAVQRLSCKSGRRVIDAKQIDRHGMDMTHVTERVGSPQPLVCAKTRVTYERQWCQYKEDLASMAVLSPLIGETDGDVGALRARLEGARERCPRQRRRQHNSNF